MALITLLRQAPVAPNASACRLCDAHIDGTFQDHLLLGQPGTSQEVLAICPACGNALHRLISVCGSELSVILQMSGPATPASSPSKRGGG
jgi:hypothetical protein